MSSHDNVTPIDSRRGSLPSFRGSPTCPQCGAIVGRKGHECRSRAEHPNWTPDKRLVTDPEAITEYVAAVRAELEAHRPPEAAPAAREDVLRTRPIL